MHRVKLILTPAGKNCTVELDGVPLSASAVHVKAGELTRVVFVLPACHVEVDATCLEESVRRTELARVLP